MNNLEEGRISTDDLKFVSLPAGVEEQYLVHENDILFNRTNSYALVGKTALVDSPIRAVFASYLIRIEPDCSKVEPRYLAQLLISEKWQSQIQALATKGVSQSNINIQNLLQLRIPIRSLQRQSEIAALLTTVDECIDQSRRITSQIKRSKSALMQNQIFSPKGTTTKFKVKPLGELFAERKEQGKTGLPTLSVTMHDGLVDREDHGRRVTSDLTPEQHLLAHKDDIVYNMMRMWQGVSGLAPYDGLVSPAYVVLRPLDGIDPLFASYLFKLPETIRISTAIRKVSPTTVSASTSSSSRKSRFRFRLTLRSNVALRRS
ncbi:MAG: restriction endonuclease subunit S [Verrucomicrobiales bacterium]|nr:restriction endonuclease subunit S [Verrucomicrobiae bacterium]